MQSTSNFTLRIKPIEKVFAYFISSFRREAAKVQYYKFYSGLIISKRKIPKGEAGSFLLTFTVLPDGCLPPGGRQELFPCWGSKTLGRFPIRNSLELVLAVGILELIIGARLSSASSSFRFLREEGRHHAEFNAGIQRESRSI